MDVLASIAFWILPKRSRESDMSGSLTRRVSVKVQNELFEVFDQMIKKYRKSLSQAITELMAAAVNRPDLSGSHKTTSPQVAATINKADIAMEKIRNGLERGWGELVEAINDLVFRNQMAISHRLIKQASTVVRNTYPEGHATRKRVEQLIDLWDTRSMSLEWGAASTWQFGPPVSCGAYLVIPEKGELRLSIISDRDHPDISNGDIECHLRVQHPPKLSEKERRIVSFSHPEPDDQQPPFPKALSQLHHPEEGQVGQYQDQLPGSQRP